MDADQEEERSTINYRLYFIMGIVAMSFCFISMNFGKEDGQKKGREHMRKALMERMLTESNKLEKECFKLPPNLEEDCLKYSYPLRSKIYELERMSAEEIINSYKTKQ